MKSDVYLRTPLASSREKRWEKEESRSEVMEFVCSFISENETTRSTPSVLTTFTYPTATSSRYLFFFLKLSGNYIQLPNVLLMDIAFTSLFIRFNANPSSSIIIIKGWNNFLKTEGTTNYLVRIKQTIFYILYFFSFNIIISKQF